MPQKLVFWDWTGTLVDEFRLDEAVCRSMEEEVARRDGIPFEEAERRFKEHLKALENTWQWHDYVLHGKALGVDWKRHQEKYLRELVLLPHAREILEYSREKGYKNVLVTNAVRPVILLRIGYLALTNLFDAIITSDDVQAMKSNGEHFRYGLKTLDGDPQLSFSVGDNPIQDIEPAKRLGIRTIYCDFRRVMMHYHTEHISANHYELVKVDYTITNLLEIKNII